MQDQISARICAGKNGWAPEVAMRRIDGHEEIRSLEIVNMEGEGTAAQREQLFRERIKMTIVSLDGKPVTYQDLDDYNERFTARQMRFLETMYAEINGVDRDELAAFRSGLRLTSGTSSPGSAGTAVKS